LQIVNHDTVANCEPRYSLSGGEAMFAYGEMRCDTVYSNVYPTRCNTYTVYFCLETTL